MHSAQPSVIERGVAGLCRVVLWCSTTVIFLILVVNTVLRYATGTSLQWANEVPELLFPWLVISGIVLAALHGAHIATTFLMAALPAGIARLVTITSWVVVSGMYATLAVATGRMLAVVHDEKSPILQLPGSLTYGCVMVGMALLSLLAALSAWRCLHTPQAGSAASGTTRKASDVDREPQVRPVHW